MFRYRLYLEDGTEVGEAVYTQYVKIGETIWAAGASKFLVLDLVPTEEDSDLFVGLLKVEPSI